MCDISDPPSYVCGSWVRRSEKKIVYKTTRTCAWSTCSTKRGVYLYASTPTKIKREQKMKIMTSPKHLQKRRRYETSSLESHKRKLSRYEREKCRTSSYISHNVSMCPPCHKREVEGQISSDASDEEAMVYTELKQEYTFNF